MKLLLSTKHPNGMRGDDHHLLALHDSNVALREFAQSL